MGTRGFQEEARSTATELEGSRQEWAQENGHQLGRGCRGCGGQEQLEETCFPKRLWRGLNQEPGYSRLDHVPDGFSKEESLQTVGESFFYYLPVTQPTVSKVPKKGTSCVRGDIICPRPSPPQSRAAEQMQRSSTFPRRIRSHTDCCSRLMH